MENSMSDLLTALKTANENYLMALGANDVSDSALEIASGTGSLADGRSTPGDGTSNPGVNCTCCCN
jgi:hypothetical protein